MKLFTTDTKAIAKAETDIVCAAVEAIESYEALTRAGFECDEYEAVVNDIAYCRDTIKKTGIKNFFYSLDKENKFADTFSLESYTPGMTVESLKSLEARYISAAEEGFGEALRNFWEKIKAFFKRIADWFKNLFSESNHKENVATVQEAKKEVAEVGKSDTSLRVKDVIVGGHNRVASFLSSVFKSEEDKVSTEALTEEVFKRMNMELGKMDTIISMVTVFYKWNIDCLRELLKLSKELITAKDDITSEWTSKYLEPNEKEYARRMETLGKQISFKEEDTSKINLGSLGINSVADAENYISKIEHLVGIIYVNNKIVANLGSDISSVCGMYNPYSDKSTDDDEALSRKVRGFSYISKWCKCTVESCGNGTKSENYLAKFAEEIANAISKEVNSVSK